MLAKGLQAVFCFFVFFFSQVGNYKRAVKRFDDGHRLCNDLMGCLQERAKIEKAYGDQLTAWSKRWRQLIEKGQSHSCRRGRAGAAWGPPERVEGGSKSFSDVYIVLFYH